MHTIPSYASETAAWPLQNLRIPFGSLAAVHYLCFSSPWLQLLSGLSFQLRTSPCKSQWPFHLLKPCTQFLLTLPRLPPGPFKTSVPFGPLAAASTRLSSCLATGRGFRRGLPAAAYWPVIPVGLSSCGGHAHNSFLRFRDLQNLRTFGPLAAASTGLSSCLATGRGFRRGLAELLIGLSLHLAFPAVEAMHTIPSYASETAKPPYPSDPSLQLPLGFPAAWPLVEAFDEALAAAAYWPVIPVGLSSCGGHAHNSFLRFRDCPPYPSDSSLQLPLGFPTAWPLVEAFDKALPLLFQPLTATPYSTFPSNWKLRTSPCKWQWPFQLMRPCTQLLPSETAAWPLERFHTLSEWLVHPFKRPSNLCCSSQCLSLLVCAHDFVRFRNCRLPPPQNPRCSLQRPLLQLPWFFWQILSVLVVKEGSETCHYKWTPETAQLLQFFTSTCHQVWARPSAKATATAPSSAQKN